MDDILGTQYKNTIFSSLPNFFHSFPPSLFPFTTEPNFPVILKIYFPVCSYLKLVLQYV